MNCVGVGERLAAGALVLAALAWPTIAPVNAQEQTREQALIDRIRQIQGQLGPDASKPAEEPAAGERALIEKIEAITRDAQAEGGASERPALGEDEVRTLLRENLGVEVLSIEAVEREGRPVYAVTVMNPPGNYNSAFLVETLLVDGATGGLLGRVPQRPRFEAPGFADSTGQADPDRSGLEIRRRTYR